MSEVRLSPQERTDRTRARAWALQIHYRWESSGQTMSLRDALVETTATRRISPRRLPYIRKILTTLDEHLDTLDSELRQALDNWRLERLSTIDRAVLRIGAVELIHFDDVPPKVSIWLPACCGSSRGSWNRASSWSVKLLPSRQRLTRNAIRSSSVSTEAFAESKTCGVSRRESRSSVSACSTRSLRVSRLSRI